MIVGIAGFKGSGKDTYYEAIKTVASVPVFRRAFGDDVKIAAGRSLGLEGDDQDILAFVDRWKNHGTVEAQAHRTWTFTFRQYIQNYGHNMRQLAGEDFWVDRTIPLFPHWSQKAVHVITDVRYENEAQRIIDNGGVIHRTNREGSESDGHFSELPLPDRYIDREIDNNGSIRDLERQAASWLL